MSPQPGKGNHEDDSTHQQQRPPEPLPKSWSKRVVLAALIAVASINIWTGSPLLAVWVGSKIQRTSTSLSMGAVFSVILVLGALEIGLIAALSRLGVAYERAAGREPRRRAQAPWMRSMRAERATHTTQREGLGAMERMLVISVVLAAAAFETWFFFFSGSSIGHG